MVCKPTGETGLVSQSLDQQLGELLVGDNIRKALDSSVVNDMMFQVEEVRRNACRKYTSYVHFERKRQGVRKSRTKRSQKEIKARWN